MSKFNLDATAAVFNHLRQVGDQRYGHGWKEMVNRQIKRATGYVTRDMAKRTMRLTTLFQVLEVLGEDPGHFFEEVFQGANPQAKTRLRCKTDSLPSDLNQLVPKLQIATDSPSFSSPLLSGILLQKRTDPASALKMAADALGLVSNSLLPSKIAYPLLLEWSSLKVQLGNLTEARAGYELAQREAGRVNAHRILAETLLRLSTLEFKESGQPSVALETAEKSYLAFTSLGHTNGMGQSLVKRSWYLHYLDANTEAIQSLSLAIEFLDSADDFTPRAHQSIGLIYNAIGEVASAQKHLRIAAELSTDDPKLTATILWVLAAIESKAGDYSKAASTYNSAQSLLAPISPVESILVAIDLAHLHLEHGDTTEALDVTKNLAPFLEPLARHPQIQGILLELIKTTISGTQLSGIYLKETASKIRRLGPSDGVLVR